MADEDFWPLNTTLYVEDFHGNNPRFIYYFLKTLEWEKFTSASAVPGINRNTVHKEVIRLPDTTTQGKIALLLKTFDDKIDVNEQIENRVVLECRKLLTDSNIEHIAASVAAVCESDRDIVSIKRIKAAIQEADTAIENLWKALEKGQAADMITERIEKRQKEKEELQAQLAIEMNKQVRLSAPDIRAYLYALKHGDKNDENTKRGIINIFLRAVYLFDETFTLILNGSDKPIVIDDILLDEIEEGLDDDLANHNLCSPLVADAPPKRKTRLSSCLSFCVQSADVGTSNYDTPRIPCSGTETLKGYYYVQF